MLKRGRIRFSIDLAPRHLAALHGVDFGSGLKAFLKFRERFYPDMLFDGPHASALADTWTEKLYYDAAFGKPTDDNVLGLFTVSDGPLPRVGMSDAALLTDILVELTETFGTIVTNSYIDGVVQNWSAAPHIIGSYSMENYGNREVADILVPVQDKVFFASEALGNGDQSTIQGAAFSAMRAAPLDS